MHNGTVTLPNTKKLEPKISGAVDQARRVQVTNPETCKSAAGFLTGLTMLEKVIKQEFALPKKQAHEIHKWIAGMEKKFLSPVDEARRIIKGKLVAYEAEERRKAEEKRRQMEAEARKREEERILAEAQALEEAGEKEEAEKALSEPVEVAPVQVKSEIPRVKGVSYRTEWQGVCADLGALVKFVAEHPEYLHLLQPNDSAIRSMARSLKEAVKIPGIKVWSEKHVAAKAI